MPGSERPMKVVDWNGRDVPDALRGLPPGRYVLQPVEDLVEIDADDDHGLQRALDELDRGEGVDHADVLDPARRAARR